MKKISFTIERDPTGRFGKRRAIELYHGDSPFRGRREGSKIVYQRRDKHVKRQMQEY